jgi:hypothetical protein
MSRDLYDLANPVIPSEMDLPFLGVVVEGVAPEKCTIPTKLPI